MKAQPFIDQLQDLGIRQFGGTLEWAGLRQAPVTGALPAAYIVDEGEAAGENRLATGHDQRVAVDMAVILILDAAARNVGTIDLRLEELRSGVRDRIFGWKHPEASGPCQYSGGRLLSADGATLAWAVRFRAPYHLRKVG